MRSRFIHPFLPFLAGALVVAPAAAQVKPSIPAPKPVKPVKPGPTIDRSKLRPKPVTVTNHPPWNFEHGGDLYGWTRTGSFASDAIIRCPTTRPRRSDTLREAATARALGGNYWSVPLPPDGLGCWLESAPGKGTATTPEIPIAGRYLHFRITGNPTTRVELQAKVGAGFIRIKEYFGEPSGKPTDVVYDLDEVHPGAYLGKPIKLVLKDDSDAGDLQLDAVRFASTAVTGAPRPPLWGFVDLHTHPVNQIGFGGNLFHGSIHPSMDFRGSISQGWRRGSSTWDPAAAAKTALPICTTAHGSALGGGTLLPPLIEKDHHATGYPDFIGWPHHTTKIHQQMYVEWLERAWAGGLRVVQADVGNHHLLAEIFDKLVYLTHDKTPNPTDDDWNIQTQAMAMVSLVKEPEVARFAEIAYSAADVRRIVGAGKLAIVLGVEVEDFGHFTTTLRGKGDVEARKLIREYLAKLHGFGIRHVFPIHLTNNAFGGTAVYNMLFLAGNLLDRGEMIKTRNAFGEGIRLRLDHVLPLFQELEALSKLPGLEGLRAALATELALRERPLGHANRLGLTRHGEILLDELMRMGFLIDVDHMSELATERTLDLVTPHHYPVMASHTAFRDLMFGTHTVTEHKDALGQVTYEPAENNSISFEPANWKMFGSAKPDAYASERARSATQLDRIRDLGGMVGVGTGAAVVPYSWKTPTGVRVVADCDGTTKSMAQFYLYLVERMRGRGVALGTDMNGLPDSLGPRFGPSACSGAVDDVARVGSLPAQVAAQKNGIRYRSASKHNWGRFRQAGTGHPWTADDTVTWAAIERFEAGLGGAPWPGITEGAARNAARMAYGFHRQRLGEPPMPDKGTDVNDDIRRAQQVYADITANRPTTDPRGTRIRAVWDAYHQVPGDNPPLVKSTLGNTDFDFNLDGLAHYGLLPDLLQDFRNIGLTDTDLAPLFRGAEDYARMWERVEAASAVIRARNP